MAEKTFSDYVERAKELIENADDVNPRLANMALRATVYNLVKALDVLHSSCQSRNR